MSSSLVAGLRNMTVSHSSHHNSTRPTTVSHSSRHDSTRPMTVSHSSHHNSTPPTIDRNVRSSTTEVLSYQPRHMTCVLWPDNYVVKKSRDLRREDLVLPAVYNSKLRHDPTVPIYDGYKTNVDGDPFDLDLFDKAFSYTPASIKPVKLGRQTSRGGFEALKSDLETAGKLNGSTEISLFTYRPKSDRNDRNSDSEIHVRVWRESEFRFDGRQVEKRVASYDFPLAALGGPRARPTAREAMWLTNVRDVLWRRTDEAFLQVFDLMAVMDIEEDQVEWLQSKHGTSSKNSVVDPMDDGFRNFERSCADLDQASASKCREIVKVSKGLLQAVFEILVDGARMEPPSSTPLHHQFVRSPEMALLQQAIKSTGKEMDGKTTKVRDVHYEMMHQLRRHMVAAFETGGMLPTLTKSEIKKLSKSDFVLEILLRPGFRRFCSRTASRLCHFLRARACRCESGSGGFHSHRGRFYYNHDAGVWTSPRKRNE